MTVISEVSRVLLENASGAGWCLMSRKEMALALGRDPKTVGNALAWLRGEGLISVSGKGTAVIYKVLFDEPLSPHKKYHPSAWPPERVERLLRLRESGLSIDVCALTMGVTRNAVIGKLYRTRENNARLSQRSDDAVVQLHAPATGVTDGIEGIHPAGELCGGATTA